MTVRLLSSYSFAFQILLSPVVCVCVFVSQRTVDFSLVKSDADPAFVGSAYIQESLPKGNLVGDDDKIYFFFSEAGKEFDFFDNTVVSRIARVCKGDIGGERVLQKKWTTFLKAQLLCSLPDDGFPFNIIQDMFVLTPGPEDWKNTVFYGVFTSQWYKGASGSSAVCSFTMDQVEKAFNGRYREVNRETQQWYTYNHPVPEPRPGAVSEYLLPSAGEPKHIMHNREFCQLQDRHALAYTSFML
ncbi:Semaphorin-4B [Xenoophorus captivus]|uniref:Semaphorin-4B n=1 Tax=Xenoophorus captivus TaxID=1517983 RepID=A0ABV0Q479_9TELE